MSIRHQALALSIAACLAQSGLAAEGELISTLIDQGQYWQSRSRSDLAAEAWQKLLRLDPGQPEALYGLGLGELDKNNTEAAHGWLDKLKAAHPEHALVPRLEQAIASRNGARGQIEATRKLAQAGKSEEAVRRYRELFGEQAPSGEMGLEFYQTLAATPKGWDEARKGLQRLEQDNPNQPRYALALAQHLSYRDATRIEAIGRLAQLTRRPEVAKAAHDGWRQALIWLNPRPADHALFEAYLEGHRDDAAVRAKLERLMAKAEAPSPVAVKLGLNLRQGFESLNDGELDVAARKFEGVLREHPSESGALGGLGVIRLRQQRFAEARQLLERAGKLGKAEPWRAALKSAGYWAQLQQADAARQANDLPRAQKLIEQAIRIDAQDPAARIALAELRGELKQYDGAEKLLRDVLARDPQHSAAIAAYADLLVKQEKFDQALRMLEQLTPQQRERIGGVAQIQAESLRQNARILLAKGDAGAAREALENALAFDPASVWVRLDLGRLYLQSERVNEARSVIDGLLLAGAEQPEALYAAALLSAENQDWGACLRALELVAPAARSPQMAALEKRARLHEQVERALGLARQGRTAQASALLRQAEQGGARGDEAMATLAAAYAEIGDAARALAMMRPLLAKGAGKNIGLLLQYATVLLATRQDAEFAGVMRQLQAKTLNPQESLGYNQLRTGYLLRQADLLRESGDLAAAYDALAPLLAERPDDARVLAALARMYGAAGEPLQALRQYRRALEGKPNDLELVLGALAAALDAKSLDDAQILAQRATLLDADNPRVLAGWARVYRALGKNAKADEYYRAALAAESRGRPDQMASQAGADSNPFRRRAAPARATTGLFDAAPVRAALPMAAYARFDAAPLVAASEFDAPRAAAPLNPPYYSTPAPAPAEAPPPLFSNERRAAPYASRVLPPAEPARRNVEPALTLREEAAQFEQQRASAVHGQMSLRARAGEAGMGQLTEVQSTVEGRIALGDGHATLKLTPLALDAGKLAADYNTASRFGSGPAAALPRAGNASSGVPVQSAAGVGLAIGYETANWKADIGSTPIGFQNTNVVGGARVSLPLSEQSKLSLGVSRRAVTDSLLSFAGTRDERTGVTWGGVTASGARAELGWDAPGYGLYGYGQAQSLQGHNVASNSALEGGAGMYLNLIKEANRELTTGLSGTTMHYRKNLGNMTYGNGGYFSPQTFFALSLPLTLSGTSDRLGYQLRGSLGVQHFRQDEAPYFPTSAALQAGAATAAAAAVILNSNNLIGASFPSVTRTALAYNFGGALEYQLSPQLTVGGALALDNGRDYRQWNSSVYLRFMLDTLSNARVTPPAPPRSPYAPGN